MIVEQRIYKIKTGRMHEYLALAENESLPMQRKALGGLIGYYLSEIGPLSQVISLWEYQSFEDRIRRRAALAADPEWQKIVKKLSDCIESAENRILLPTKFSAVTELPTAS